MGQGCARASVRAGGQDDRVAVKRQPPRTRLDFQDDKAMTTPGPVRDALMAQMARMGSKDIRYNVIYGQTKGGTDLHVFDELKNAARRYGMRVQPTLMSDPRYLNPTSGLTYYNNDPKLWGQFARNFAQRERGQVSRVEVGNEPNFDAFIKGAQANPTQAGRTYRNLYRAAYAGLKSADPSVGVLLGGVTSGGGDPRKFLQGALGGKGLHASGFSYHPYQDDASATTWDINRLGDLQKTLAKYKRLGKLQTVQGKAAPLYLTEMGYQRGSMPEAQRMILAAQALQKAQAAGARQLVQYQLTDKTGLPSLAAAGADGYGNPVMGLKAAPAAPWDTSIGSAGGDLSAYARMVSQARRRTPPRRTRRASV